MFKGSKVFVGEDKKVLEMDNGNGCTTTGTYLMSLPCTFKIINFMFCVFFCNERKLKQTRPTSESLILLLCLKLLPPVSHSSCPHCVQDFCSNVTSLEMRGHLLHTVLGHSWSPACFAVFTALCTLNANPAGLSKVSSARPGVQEGLRVWVQTWPCFQRSRWWEGAGPYP